MSEPLEISIAPSERAPEITILTLKGSMGSDTIHTVSGAFDAILKDHTSLVVAEMSGVTSISSAALGELLGGRKQCIDKNGSLSLCSLTLNLRTKLTLMGANKIFKFHADIRSAVNAFKWEYGERSEILNLAFPPHLKFVPAIRQMASRISLQKGYSRKDSFRIETIVDEICNNAVEHGKKETTQNVALKMRIDRKKIEIKVTSESNPVKLKNLENFINPSQDHPVEQKDYTRGRGLSLIKLLSSELDIDFTESGTSVRAVKLKEE